MDLGSPDSTLHLQKNTQEFYSHRKKENHRVTHLDILLVGSIRQVGFSIDGGICRSQMVFCSVLNFRPGRGSRSAKLNNIF